MKKFIAVFVLLSAALAVYVYFCNLFNFTQDDAYISYRYVENYLNGHGLVFNVGERVEGYTNFGWVVYLIFWGALGAGYIFISKVTGMVFGGGVIILTYLIARLHFDKGNAPFVWLAVWLVALNQSLAYWSPAGLETAAFAFFAMLSVYLFLTRNRLLILSLTLATLLRPEGGLVAGLLIIVEAVQTRGRPWFSLSSALAAGVFLLPLAVFKIVYYGSLLPNPFYAKTALTGSKLVDGLEYVGRFMSHYGFYGFGLLVPLLFYRRLSEVARATWLFLVLYIAYIVLVGGDVLKVHRFFVSLFGLSAIMLSLSLAFLLRRLAIKTRYMVLFAVAVPLIAATYILPWGFVRQYNRLEKAFTVKMSFMADKLKRTDSSNFSVAISTIGIFGYELLGHRVIDMLGLTDSTVARHPDRPVAGMTSTWKEQKFSARYILSQKPDYILFSTGRKPSAPAEKALYLYRRFLDCYRIIGFPHVPDEYDARANIRMIFKRLRDSNSPLVPEYPIEMVEYYKQGIEARIGGRIEEAIDWYQRALDVSPEPAYVYILFDIGYAHMAAKNHELAMTLMDSVIALDSAITMAHGLLYKEAALNADTLKAVTHRRWLGRLVPWLVPAIDAEIVRELQRRSYESQPAGGFDDGN